MKKFNKFFKKDKMALIPIIVFAIILVLLALGWRHFISVSMS